MPIDHVYFYFHHLETGLEKPQLLKLCNALKTLDCFLKHEKSYSRKSLTPSSCASWLNLRDELFLCLIKNFPGHIQFFSKSGEQLPFESEWLEDGTVIFCPQKATRATESYKQQINRLPSETQEKFKQLFQHRKDFLEPDLQASSSAENNAEREKFLNRLQFICEEEVEVGRKRAQAELEILKRELSTTRNARERNELSGKIHILQLVWGS